MMGYGDSGPQWINTITGVLFVVGGFAGIALSQVVYFVKIKGRENR